MSTSSTTTTTTSHLLTDGEHKEENNKTDEQDVRIVSQQQEESPLQGGPLLTVPDSSEIEALAVDVARDSGLPLSRAKEILVTQYFRHNTEMLKERQQWLRHREQQEQRAMLFMDDQRQRWERLKKMNEEENRRRDQDRLKREKMERETRKQNDLHFRTMYEMKRGKIKRNVRTIVYLSCGLRFVRRLCVCSFRISLIMFSFRFFSGTAIFGCYDLCCDTVLVLASSTGTFESLG